MICAAYDLANNSGWAFGDGKTAPTSGHIELYGFNTTENLARSLGSIDTFVFSMVRANGIDVVLPEAALRGVFRKGKRGFATSASSHGDRVLTMLSGAAIAGAARAGAMILEPVAPTTWRKGVFGNGKPKDPKTQAWEYCRLMGWKVETEDEAEACCILVYAHGRVKERAMLGAK